MNSETWSKVKGVFDACLELDPVKSRQYVDEVCGGNEELRNEVQSLLEAHANAGDFIAYPVLRESFVGLLFGHWKVVADIGEGGMSRVCLAERADGQFQQRAAVKILKRGMDTDLILRHFQMERQILAGMRHLNVARLLDGGVTPDGRPFFVMEYIEGEPIDRYADANNLGTSERLRLFQQVCAAVHYAHQRLVVHRDIKPSNILVTPDGTVKLLDFGIATIVSAEPALGTLTSIQMLTPDYASPEQIRGELVTTASDVYSLGVLLYRLLTGVNPYGLPSGQQELVAAICQRDPPRPSTAEGRDRGRKFSGDLDNVVLKALEKDPQQRYSSAEQFSHDIGHYLDGRPVLARAHTFRYKTSKFVTRNKLALGAAALMIFLLVAGVVATSWQARIARMERRRAEERFGETRQLANSLMFELHDAIKDLPGSTAARALIIQRSLTYLDRISAASPADAALQLECAEGYKRLGDVEGRSGTANLGDYALARQSYQKALAILQKPVRDPSLDRKRRRLTALTLLRLQGLPEISRALDILKDLHDTAPNDAAALLDLAAGDGAMADILVERRDLSKSLEFRLKEWALQKQILDADHNDMQATRSYALASKKIGSILWMMNRVPEARDYYASALRLEERWSELEPWNADARMAVSFTHSDIGLFLAAERKFQEALQHYRTTVKIREELAQSDPNNARATLGLVSAYWRTASVSISAGEAPYALSLLNKGVKTLTDAKKPDPGSPRIMTEFAQVYGVYGEFYAAAGDARTAREWYGRSRQILSNLHESGTLDANGADRLEIVERELATLRKMP